MRLWFRGPDEVVPPVARCLLREGKWTVVRLVEVAAGSCAVDAIPCPCPEEAPSHPFTFREELDGPRADPLTRELRAAGAGRVYTLRFRPGRCLDGLELLEEYLAGSALLFLGGPEPPRIDLALAVEDEAIGSSDGAVLADYRSPQLCEWLAARCAAASR